MHSGGRGRFHVRFLRHERSLGKPCEKRSILAVSSTVSGLMSAFGMGGGGRPADGGDRSAFALLRRDEDGRGPKKLMIGDARANAHFALPPKRGSMPCVRRSCACSLKFCGCESGLAKTARRSGSQRLG